MKQSARALVGNMRLEEALQLMANGSMPIELQQRDLIAAWESIRRNLKRRKAFDPVVPLITPPDELDRAFKEVADRPDVKAVMQAHEWSVSMVDLTKSVLSYQRLVIERGAETRLGSVTASDFKALMNVCLPPAAPETFKGSFDPAQNAFTAWSLNPNLRVAGFGVAATPIPGLEQPQQLFGFRMSFGARFVQVAEYQGRWMVRDGYHRIYGLLKKGITQIPCLVVRAKTFEETGAGRPGFFDHEVMFSSQPPRVTDFLSDDFAVDVQVQAVTRVVRIRAEEFAIPIHEPGEVEASFGA